MPPALRLFAGPSGFSTPEPPSVTVRLGELAGALTAAGGRAWVEDFADEPIAVSPDLAELLHAARLMRDEPAAKAA